MQNNTLSGCTLQRFPSARKSFSLVSSTLHFSSRVIQLLHVFLQVSHDCLVPQNRDFSFVRFVHGLSGYCAYFARMFVMVIGLEIQALAVCFLSTAQIAYHVRTPSLYLAYFQGLDISTSVVRDSTPERLIRRSRHPSCVSSNPFSVES